MTGKNLFEKVWEKHAVAELPTGQTQLFIGLHLIHEVTSPQAFQMLRERGLSVKHPENTFATIDHIIPTEDQQRPYKDKLAELMAESLDKNTKENNIKFFNTDSGKQGVVHIIGPELGLTQPGMTICCGDSHTSTHGAFGSISFGIGTSQVRDVLATQCLAMTKLKVRRIEVNGELQNGVYPKDVILHIIKTLGVNGGIGYAYEFAGNVFDNMTMEERMTVCNMSIEGGARCGYVNPDQTTYDYIKNREYAPKENDFEEAVKYWKSIASDTDAHYDDIIKINGSEIVPTVTWGITPGQGIGISENLPSIDSFKESDKKTVEKAYEYMDLVPGESIIGTKIDVAFIGSCTNGRISDFREAAKIINGKKVAENVRAIAVPGSQQVDKMAKEEGLDKIFIDSGFEWRKAGCSMCLAMNPDKLKGREISASTSNRNFIGRQGSPTGRTILMSPAMVGAAAINGKIIDIREVL
ncbi:3-isopropylmalate dehydratase large subunit [archaeon]|nr:3-isopropylmalate dehydratase large subunit [archaeon]MBT4351412.1 3-isopropylmalate dehydratase large subunit [archaeon]MBT4647298.1 3-isopropylmalate dehydratase large subunit [archaeon]MBT6821139.1 3-isopropylmalate dehydratase large subunit [archaeon]MBT7391693.1 3-isopropylmalate dehydratase large subunit [archaeon]